MRILFFVFLFLLSINLNSVFAQEILSLETAIQEALENNYNIKVTEIQEEIAQNNFISKSPISFYLLNFSP